MAKRAMTHAHASQVKVEGHRNESQFAEAIDGRVHKGKHTDKRDVIDGSDYSHSVKAGKWWQIFLYGEQRLKTNTMFQGIGNVASIMVACIGAYPQTFDEYKADKPRFKEALREPMRALRIELENPDIFGAFLEKAMFDGGNAEYLSIYAGPAVTPPHQKHFHIFNRRDVCRILNADLTARNSMARHDRETSEQKVVFFSAHHEKQIGEIEDRHDSPRHFREMKFRVNGLLILRILQNAGLKEKRVNDRVTAYGVAAGRKF